MLRSFARNISTVTNSTNDSALEPMVKKLAYRVKLNADDRAAIMALPFRLKSLERNHHLVREHDRTTHSCVMLSGFSVRTKIVGTGNRQIVAIHMKGEMVDLQNSLLECADHSVQMLTSSRVAVIPREAIIQLTMDRPKIAHAMWIDTLVEGSISREWVANVGRRDARTRIAHLFCEFALRLKVAGLGHESNYELPMSQSDIADATGLTAVHVNRTIKALERDGLIERVHPRSITIGDWKKLADVGDFDSNYLHMRAGEPALT